MYVTDSKLFHFDYIYFTYKYLQTLHSDRNTNSGDNLELGNKVIECLFLYGIV